MTGVQLPALPPLLTNILAPSNLDAAPVDLNFGGSICQLQSVSEDTRSVKLGTTNLFCDGDFDQRSRKPYFSTLEILSAEQWQADVDLFINRLLNQLSNGPYSSIAIDFPVITRVSREGQTHPTTQTGPFHILMSANGAENQPGISSTQPHEIAFGDSGLSRTLILTPVLLHTLSRPQSIPGKTLFSSYCTL